MQLLIKKLRHKPAAADIPVLKDLKAELSSWEEYLVINTGIQRPEDVSPEDFRSQMSRDCSTLFVIVASILTEHMLAGDVNTAEPSAHDPDCRRLRYAASILRSYQDDTTWPKCFTSSIPVYTIGFFMTRTDDINLVRQDLLRRWEVTKFGFLLRYRNDLEATWKARGVGS